VRRYSLNIAPGWGQYSLEGEATLDKIRLKKLSAIGCQPGTRQFSRRGAGARRVFKHKGHEGQEVGRGGEWERGRLAYFRGTGGKHVGAQFERGRAALNAVRAFCLADS
jgi:hypothetical protein